VADALPFGRSQRDERAVDLPRLGVLATTVTIALTLLLLVAWVVAIG
jgi:hypothetical protein